MSWELSNATKSALERDEAQKRTSGSKGSDTNPIRPGHRRSGRERDSFGWNKGRILDASRPLGMSKVRDWNCRTTP